MNVIYLKHNNTRFWQTKGLVGGGTLKGGRRRRRCGLRNNNDNTTTGVTTPMSKYRVTTHYLKPRLTKYLMGDPLFGVRWIEISVGPFLPAKKNPLKKLSLNIYYWDYTCTFKKHYNWVRSRCCCCLLSHLVTLWASMLLCWSSSMVVVLRSLWFRTRNLEGKVRQKWLKKILIEFVMLFLFKLSFVQKVFIYLLV